VPIAPRDTVGRNPLASTARAKTALVMTLLPRKRETLRVNVILGNRAVRMTNSLIILSYKLRPGSPMSVIVVT